MPKSKDTEEKKVKDKLDNATFADNVVDSKIRRSPLSKVDTESIESHIGVLSGLQQKLIDAVEHQSTQTEKLNDTISGLSGNIEKGFSLFTMGAKLVKLVIYTFVLTISLLGCLIVYITHTKLTMNLQGVKISNNEVKLEEVKEPHQEDSTIQTLVDKLNSIGKEKSVAANK